MKLPDRIAGGTRPAATLLLSACVGLVAVSDIAAAGFCDMMLKGPYAGMPMPVMPHPMYKGMQAGPAYRPRYPQRRASSPSPGVPGSLAPC